MTCAVIRCRSVMYWYWASTPTSRKRSVVGGDAGDEAERADHRRILAAVPVVLQRDAPVGVVAVEGRGGIPFDAEPQRGKQVVARAVGREFGVDRVAPQRVGAHAGHLLAQVFDQRRGGGHVRGRGRGERKAPRAHRVVDVLHLRVVVQRETVEEAVPAHVGVVGVAQVDVVDARVVFEAVVCQLRKDAHVLAQLAVEEQARLLQHGFPVLGKILLEIDAARMRGGMRQLEHAGDGKGQARPQRVAVQLELAPGGRQLGPADVAREAVEPGLAGETGHGPGRQHAAREQDGGDGPPRQPGKQSHDDGLAGR